MSQVGRLVRHKTRKFGTALWMKERCSCRVSLVRATALIIFTTQLMLSQSNSRTGRCTPWKSVKLSASTAPKAWRKTREIGEFKSDDINWRNAFGCAAWSLPSSCSPSLFSSSMLLTGDWISKMRSMRS